MSDRPDECAAEIMEVIPLVMRMIRREMRRRRSEGLSVPEFRAMIFLSRQPLASLTEVADHLGVTTPTVCALIDALVARNLVCREDSSVDRRKIVLTLTPEGQSILSSAHQGTLDQIEEWIEALSPAERAAILQSMQILSQVFSSVEPSAQAR
jgi:DNA-binding MarR family transcriptional regulator